MGSDSSIPAMQSYDIFKVRSHEIKRGEIKQRPRRKEAHSGCPALMYLTTTEADKSTSSVHCCSSRSVSHFCEDGNYTSVSGTPGVPDLAGTDFLNPRLSLVQFHIIIISLAEDLQSGGFCLYSRSVLLQFTCHLIYNSC